MAEQGLSCWRQGCDEQFNITVPDSVDLGEALDRLDAAAGKAGWVIGHFDGQAHYACPCCASTLHDPMPLKRIGRLWAGRSCGGPLSDVRSGRTGPTVRKARRHPHRSQPKGDLQNSTP